MKTKETIELEHRLHLYLYSRGLFHIFECTIGFGGGGRVDCIAINTKDIVTCFEIKVTESDFKSKHGHNFAGNLNYYIMPSGLYDKVKNSIPDNVGVYVPYSYSLICAKKSKRVKINNLMDIKNYMIRSLYREYSKNIDSNNIRKMQYYKNEAEKYKKQYYAANKKLHGVYNVLYNKFTAKEARELIKSIDI